MNEDNAQMLKDGLQGITTILNDAKANPQLAPVVQGFLTKVNGQVIYLQNKVDEILALDMGTATVANSSYNGLTTFSVPERDHLYNIWFTKNKMR